MTLAMNQFNIEKNKLDYLYKNLTSSLLGIFILASIIFFGFYNLTDEHLYLWYILNVFILFLRVISLIFYKKTNITERNFSLYYWIFFVFSSLSAFLWGSLAFYILPLAMEHQMIVLIFVAAIVSGAAISFASRIEIFYVYLPLTIIPFIYIFAFNNGDSYKLLAFSLITYIIIIAALSKKISTNIIQNIQTAEVNKNLVLELEKKVEEADSANKAKSEFLSVMSHEIRTPLNAIMGFVSLLKKNEEDLEKFKYLDTIDQSSKILTNVINDILDLSKIESGNFTLENLVFQPKEEFQSIYLLFELTASEKGVIFHNSIADSLPKYLNSDILRIKQILSNLLSNAIKFTNAGKNVGLFINFDEKTSSLLFEVKDEGIGISEENIIKVTEAFVQADSSTVRKYGGTGLGLSIVTNLLHLFNSKLKIESEIDKGSSFSFAIKVTQETSLVDQNDTSLNMNLKGKKFLVAEDNKTNQMLIKLLLNDLDIDVKIAENGLEAEAMFQKEFFDMVLMDINMPIKNGTEAMLAIKHYQDTQKTSVPIIALTANALSTDKEKYIKQGFDDYLAKPIDNASMMHVFSKFFD